MSDATMLLACIVAALVSSFAISVLRRFAKPLGLIDRPNERKHHSGDIPLIGGLAIFAGTLAGAFYYGGFGSTAKILLGSSALITFLGALDDRYNLGVRLRLLAQITTILIVVFSTDVYVHTLGNIFGHKMVLGWFGIPFTIFAIIGLVNAFNMIDGIDGLAGSLALVSIAAIMLFDGGSHLRSAAMLMTLLGAATLPYLVVNLGSTRHQIFMGDAGSMVVGYLLGWALIRLSQIPGSHLTPVDTLWCVALPVLDTFAAMYRRIRQHKSPFKGDRGHIHHILMRAGLSQRATLAALIALACALILVGLAIRRTGPTFSLLVFITLGILYITTVSQIYIRQQSRAVNTFTAVGDDVVPPADSMAKLMSGSAVGLVGHTITADNYIPHPAVPRKPSASDGLAVDGFSVDNSELQSPSTQQHKRPREVDTAS
jgi:UDP-GlcNAc:undecaprenyl-phosphate GlcNAc-1-phosphate transferase